MSRESVAPPVENSVLLKQFKCGFAELKCSTYQRVEKSHGSEAGVSALIRSVEFVNRSASVIKYVRNGHLEGSRESGPVDGIRRVSHWIHQAMPMIKR